jgi:glutamate-5-semialdehyde dehydrogenase
MLAIAPSQQKTAALEAMADALTASSGDIIAANGATWRAGEKAGLTPAMLDRLKLTQERVQAMADGVRAIARWRIRSAR